MDLFYQWQRTHLPIVDNHRLGHLSELGKQFVRMWEFRAKVNGKYQSDLVVLFDNYHKHMRSANEKRSSEGSAAASPSSGRTEQMPVFVFGADTSVSDEMAIPAPVAALFKSVDSASYGGRRPLLSNVQVRQKSIYIYMNGQSFFIGRTGEERG